MDFYQPWSSPTTQGHGTQNHEMQDVGSDDVDIEDGQVRNDRNANADIEVDQVQDDADDEGDIKGGQERDVGSDDVNIDDDYTDEDEDELMTDECREQPVFVDPSIPSDDDTDAAQQVEHMEVSKLFDTIMSIR